MAEAQKMRQEDVKAAGAEASKRPFRQQAEGVAHPRRALPFSPTTMAAGGLVLVAAVTYFTLYAKKKPEASAVDVAKAAAGKVDPATTQQRR